MNSPLSTIIVALLLHGSHTSNWRHQPARSDRGCGRCGTSGSAWHLCYESERDWAEQEEGLPQFRAGLSRPAKYYDQHCTSGRRTTGKTLRRASGPFLHGKKYKGTRRGTAGTDRFRRREPAANGPILLSNPCARDRSRSNQHRFRLSIGILQIGGAEAERQKLGNPHRFDFRTIAVGGDHFDVAA